MKHAIAGALLFLVFNIFIVTHQNKPDCEHGYHHLMDVLTARSLETYERMQSDGSTCIYFGKQTACDMSRDKADEKMAEMIEQDCTPDCLKAFNFSYDQHVR